MRELTGNDFFLEAQNRLQNKIDNKEEITVMDVFAGSRPDPPFPPCAPLN